MKQYLRQAICGIKKKSHFIAIPLIFLVLFSLTDITVWAKSPIMRIGIFLDNKEVALNCEKGLRIYEIPTMKTLLIQDKNVPIKITANLNGIEINNQLFNSVNEIKITPGNTGLIQVGNRKYRGEIEIISAHGLLNVINIIEMEKYLYGVLKKEISPEWPEEALKAQAIAARTFALSNMNKFIDKGFNICATTISQVYGGVYHEHPATNKAVDDTRGIIVTYQGEPINAVYHSDSGGYTENSEDVWGSHVPYLRSVPSNYEKFVSPPNHQWNHSFSEQEILTKLVQQGFQLTHINNIVIEEETEYGRVKSVDIFGDNNQIINLKANDLRLLLGPTVIRSSLFTIDTRGSRAEESSRDSKSPDVAVVQEEKPQKKSVRDILREDRDFSISELIALLNRTKEEKESQKVTLPEVREAKQSNDLFFSFSGQGYGHGVGLSQWGAYGMALKGYNYEDILKHYYQGTQLNKMY